MGIGKSRASSEAGLGKKLLVAFVVADCIAAGLYLANEKLSDSDPDYQQDQKPVAKTGQGGKLVTQLPDPKFANSANAGPLAQAGKPVAQLPDAKFASSDMVAPVAHAQHVDNVAMRPPVTEFANSARVDQAKPQPRLASGTVTEHQRLVETVVRKPNLRRSMLHRNPGVVSAKTVQTTAAPETVPNATVAPETIGVIKLATNPGVLVAQPDPSPLPSARAIVAPSISNAVLSEQPAPLPKMPRVALQADVALASEPSPVATVAPPAKLPDADSVVGSSPATPRLAFVQAPSSVAPPAMAVAQMAVSVPHSGIGKIESPAMAPDTVAFPAVIPVMQPQLTNTAHDTAPALIGTGPAIAPTSTSNGSQRLANMASESGAKLQLPEVAFGKAANAIPSKIAATPSAPTQSAVSQTQHLAVPVATPELSPRVKHVPNAQSKTGLAVAAMPTQSLANGCASGGLEADGVGQLGSAGGTLVASTLAAPKLVEPTASALFSAESGMAPDAAPLALEGGVLESTCMASASQYAAREVTNLPGSIGQEAGGTSDSTGR